LNGANGRVGGCGGEPQNNGTLKKCNLLQGGVKVDDPGGKRGGGWFLVVGGWGGKKTRGARGHVATLVGEDWEKRNVFCETQPGSQMRRWRRGEGPQPAGRDNNGFFLLVSGVAVGKTQQGRNERSYRSQRKGTKGLT